MTLQTYKAQQRYETMVLIIKAYLGLEKLEDFDHTWYRDKPCYRPAGVSIAKLAKQFNVSYVSIKKAVLRFKHRGQFQPEWRDHRQHFGGRYENPLPAEAAIKIKSHEWN